MKCVLEVGERMNDLSRRIYWLDTLPDLVPAKTRLTRVG